MPRMSSLSLARSLAVYALTQEWETFPEDIRHQSVRATLNWMGCALGAARSEATGTALGGLSALGHAGSARLVGRSERLDAANAALVNCLSSAAYAYDDTHLETVTHPTGPVAAVLFALADTEGRRIDGRALLSAVIVGIEIQCRLSAALLAPGGASVGWWITGVTGGIGAAAAAARILGLTEDETVAALGLAATQAAGLRATHGSMASPIVPAFAARAGLTAAALAAAGYGCSESILDGRNGLFDVIAPEVDRGRAVEGLGERFELRDLSYKPYPAGIILHPLIDACLEIRRRPGFDVGSLAQVDVSVDPLAGRLAGPRLPANSFEAKVSVYHWAAASLCLGKAGMFEMSDGCVRRPDVRALQEKIAVQTDPDLASDQARVTATFADGNSMTVTIEHATGSRENPMSDEALQAKFVDQAAPLLQDHATPVADACWRMPHVEDVRAVLDQACFSVV